MRLFGREIPVEIGHFDEVGLYVAGPDAYNRECADDIDEAGHPTIIAFGGKRCKINGAAEKISSSIIRIFT